MLKKLSVLGLATLLAACTSSPKEPKYKISNEEMQAILLWQNNIEQCIYPQLRNLPYAEAERLVYSRASQEEKVVMAYYFKNNIRSVIGDFNYGILSSDEASQDYFDKLHKAQNHQLATGISYQECEVLKARFYDDLQRTRGY